MKKEWSADSEFGELPFKTVGKIEFAVTGMKKPDDAAFLQYQLLLKPEILQCHIEYAKQKGTVFFNPLDANAQTILEEFPRPFQAKLESEQKIAYRNLVGQSYHLR